VLALLVYLFARQIHTWAQFDWHVFVAQIGRAKLAYALAAFALIYFGFVLRAYRWREFIAHSCHTTIGKLLGPTFIGFTSLALFGRPGEFLRPYLIARKEQLSFSSQLAVWTVERIFDMSGFGLLFGLGLAFGSMHTQNASADHNIRYGGYVILLIIAVLAIGAAAMARYGASVAERMRQRPGGALRWLAHQLQGFASGFHTIKSAASFARISVASVVMWGVIAGAYWFSIHAFPAPLSDFGLRDVVVLMMFSMLGSLVQLPGGSTSSLVVVLALQGIFNVPQELALSCGIMIWVTTYMAPIPAGLAVARREHLSLRRLEHEAEEEAEEEVGAV
jgi:glycosyltransferase 2 family protein